MILILALMVVACCGLIIGDDKEHISNCALPTLGGLFAIWFFGGILTTALGVAIFITCYTIASK